MGDTLWEGSVNLLNFLFGDEVNELKLVVAAQRDSSLKLPLEFLISSMTLL
jgi:hypothetical protein